MSEKPAAAATTNDKIENAETVETVETAPLSASEKSEHAQDIAQTSMYCAMGAGLVPIPLFDFIAVTGIQLEMLRRLSHVYDVQFSAHTGKNIIGSLVGGGVPSILSPLVASTVKVIPIIGSTLGAISMPVIAGATTYAIAKVFIQHFESGGTFLTLDPKAVKEYYAEKLKEGTALAKAAQAKATQAKTAAA
jgi:uncharacterized protein (DUF697 family)